MVRQNVAFFHTLKLTHSDLKVGIVCMPGANTTDVNWDTIFPQVFLSGNVHYDITIGALNSEPLLLIIRVTV